MSDSIPGVLSEMASMWYTRRDGVVQEDYGRSRDVLAADVRAVLVDRHGEEAVRVQVLRFLDHMCDVYQIEKSGDRAETFVCDCALAMVTDEGGGIEAPIELVQRIVRVLPTPIWHFPMGQLIGRYLTITKLLEALLTGIAAPRSPYSVENGLMGFRLYLGTARPDDDPRKPGFVQRCRERLGELAVSNDPEVAGLAKGAMRSLEGFVGGA